MTGQTPAAELDALISELAESDVERETMTIAVRALAYEAPDVRPSTDLRDRILARIAEGDRPPQFMDGFSFFARSADLQWIQLTPGVEIKVLHAEAAGARTLLVRMGPNLPFPPHPHDFVEDLYLVSGDAWVGHVPMRAGDYCRAPSGMEHNDVRSGPSGALAVVISR
jgi:hypothetical protein